MRQEITETFLNDNSNVYPKDAVAALILDSKENILLQLRDNKTGIFFPNHWGFFGGAIDENESPKDSLFRELEEELSISFNTSEVTAFITSEICFKPGEASVKRYFFLVKIYEDLMKKIEVSEGQEANLFSCKDGLKLPNFVPYDRFALWSYYNQHRILFE